jgi:type IV pilus biogenesis protein CpaD/CtpE
MRISPVLPLLFALAASLTACEHNTDLIAKLNAEPLGNTNESNIAVMVTNPADLVRGHGGGTSGDPASALAVDRIRTDHQKPLASPGGGSGGGGGGGGSGGGASGG